MGFIKKIIGNLLAFLGGLFGSFGKVVGFNKSGYFLELDESKDEPQPSAPAKTVSTPTVSTSNGASPKPEPAKLEPAKAKPVQPVNETAVQISAAEKTADSPVPASKPAVSLTDPQPVPTFAPEFLMPAASQNGRRRPGPSMGYFLDMAKKVKA